MESARTSKLRHPLLIALTALLLAGFVPAQEPGFGDLGRGTASAHPPTVARPRPRDALDALVKGLPGGSRDLEEWWNRWEEDYREEAAAGFETEDPLERSEQLFSGIFGETAGTATRNRDAVLATLESLTPPGDDPARNELLEGLLDALAERVARGIDTSTGSRREQPKEPILAALRRLAERPRGLGPADEDALGRLGLQLWDYKAAALVLLEWAAPRRREADRVQFEELLESPPDPVGELDARTLIERIDARLEEVEGQEEARRSLQHTRTRARRLRKQRNRAISDLREIVGRRALTGPDLLAAAVRRQAARGDVDVNRRMRSALLRLGRAEAGLMDLAEGLQLPTPGEVRTGPDGAVFRGLSTEDLGSRIREDVLDADVQLSARLFDLDLVPGVSLSAKYRWELEGEAREQSWTRVDEWRLKGQVRVGDLLRGVFDLPFGVNLDHDREILLVRSFATHGAAIKAMPKTPLSLPLTGERARDMPVGWFWSLPVRLQAVASLAYGYSEGLVSARGYSQYLLRGRFRLNVFKEGPGQVRVQLIGAHERGPSYGVRSDLAVEVFGIRLLDRAVDNLVDFELLHWDHRRSRGVGIAIDYLMDLDHPEVRDAYDKLVRVSLGYGGLLATHPQFSATDMQERMLVDLRPTERLFLEDREKPVEERRVDRRFLGTNTFRVRETRLKMGPRLARWGRNRRWIENDLRVIRPDGAVERYDFPMFSFWDGWSVLFGYWKESRELQAFSLMEVPEGERAVAVGPQGLVLAGSYRDRKASQREVESLHESTMHALGPGLSAAIGLDAVEVRSGGKHLRAAIMLALHPPATARILDPARTDDQAVRQAAVRAAVAYGKPERAAALVEDLLLVRAVPGVPGGQRQVTALARLTDSPLWRELGPRFLVELVGTPSTRDLHVDVAWKGKDVEAFTGRYGQPQHEELQKIVSEALSAVSDRDRPLESR